MARETSTRVSWRWLAVLAVVVLWSPAPAPVAARPDIVFHVPEVLVRHAAVPRPVGTGRSNTSRLVNETDPWADEGGLVQKRYEYYVEHEVSTADAKKAAQKLKVKLRTKEGPGCGVCSRRDMEYCETKVVADHCCCEFRFRPEPFPWLPHTCYIGAEPCSPLAGNCAFYTRLRDCCCANRLAVRWKGILSKSDRLGASGVSLLLLSIVLFTAYL